MGLRERRINRIKFEDIVNEAETIDDRSEYISNGDKAVELIAGLISSSCDTKQNSINEIDKQIDDLFSLYSDITLENELEHYRRMKVLCARLKEQQKISNKVVVGFGGQFSAGKSAFINAICGLDHVLPEAQKPTTSLPTYIIRNSDPSYKETIFSATTNRGMTVPLDVQKMKALTHEFHKEYGIGFSSFIESITVESPQYNLPANIALLDTPGYSKFDNKADSKQVFSDREKAERQLRTAKYLIWLVDIENGVVKQEDIKFLKELKVEAPILVVLNKADKKTQNEIDSIIEVCQQTIDNNGIPCMGIAAYSARECKEYTNGIISK